MLIMRAVNWYRPYYITASGRGYKVERIHFYKDDKILVSTCGWLEKEKYGDITSLELPIDEIKVRRKEKFDGSVFAISKGKGDYSTDLLAELYIPAEMLDVHFEKNVIKYKTKIYAIYRGANDIYISTYVKSCDDELNHGYSYIEAEYDDCFLVRS